MLKKRRSIRPVIIFIIIVLLTSGFIFFDQRVRPTVQSIAEIESKQMAIGAINTAVRAEITKNNINYNDFITWQKDNQGRVAVMQANTVRVNQMQADIALHVQKQLRELEGEIIPVPLGQVLGTYLLAHRGPKFNVKIMPFGTVDVHINDMFEQAGINQTRHKIYLDFTTTVRLVIPLGVGETEIATQVPVVESVIIGDVPQVVADFSGGVFGGLNNK